MLTRPDFLRQLTVSKLAELLTQLQPADYLVVNGVGDLAICRDGSYIGFLSIADESVTIFGQGEDGNS